MLYRLCPALIYFSGETHSVVLKWRSRLNYRKCQRASFLCLPLWREVDKSSQCGSCGQRQKSITLLKVGVGGLYNHNAHNCVLKDVDSRLCHAEEKHARLRLQAVCVHYFNCLFIFYIFSCSVYSMCAQLENADLFSHLPEPEHENTAWRVGALDWSHTLTYFFCAKGVLHSFFYYFSPPRPSSHTCKHFTKLLRSL